MKKLNFITDIYYVQETTKPLNKEFFKSSKAMKLYISFITYVNMGKRQISIQVIKYIFTQIFHEQHERQEPLFKSHEEVIYLSINLPNQSIYLSTYLPT